MIRREPPACRDWRDALNQLLCAGKITGYALLDGSGTVVFGFGEFSGNFMTAGPEHPDLDAEKKLLTEVLCVSSPQVPGAITINGRRMVVVRRTTSMLFAVAPRKESSASLHNVYAGTLVVSYGPRYPPAVDAVLALLD